MMICEAKYSCSVCDEITDFEIEIEDLPDDFNQRFILSERTCSHCSEPFNILMQLEIWSEGIENE